MVRHLSDNRAYVDFPPITRQRKPLSIWGVFDGDTTTTDVSVDGEKRAVLAEDYRHSITESPRALGTVPVSVTRHGTEVTGQTRVVSLDLSIPGSIEEGEHTTIDVTIDGLSGLGMPSEPVYFLWFQNLAPDVARIDRNHATWITSDVVSGGPFATTIPLEGVSGGTIDLRPRVTVRPPLHKFSGHTPTPTPQPTNSEYRIRPLGYDPPERADSHRPDKVVNNRKQWRRKFQAGLFEEFIKNLKRAGITKKSDDWGRCLFEAEMLSQCIVDKVMHVHLDLGYTHGWADNVGNNLKNTYLGCNAKGKCSDWVSAMNQAYLKCKKKIKKITGKGFQCWNVKQLYGEDDGFLDPATHTVFLVWPKKGKKENGVMIDPWGKNGWPKALDHTPAEDKTWDWHSVDQKHISNENDD
jgi:hypothetical protein